MGTRGLVGHIVRSKNLRKGSYNHFDSYPSGLGRDIALFILGLTDEQIETMIENLGKIEWVKEGAEDSKPSQEVQDRYTTLGFIDTGVASKSTADWYCLLRNVQGAAALPRILDGSLTHLVDGTSFEEDETFCEWSYFVDWEQRVLHVRGGGKEGSVGFRELSEEWMVEFEKSCREEDDE